MRDMLLGKERFEEFLASHEGIASNILANRLARLRRAGIIERRASPSHRGRATYHLTKRGAQLKAVLEAVARWGLENVPGTRLANSSR